MIRTSACGSAGFCLLSSRRCSNLWLAVVLQTMAANVAATWVEPTAPPLNESFQDGSEEMRKGGAWIWHDRPGKVSWPPTFPHFYSSSAAAATPAASQAMVDISVVSQVPIKHMDEIQVHFRVEVANSTAAAASSDADDEWWIGVYCPSDAADHDYIDFMRLLTKDGGIPDEATLTFGPMVNMRCEYEFRLFRGGQALARTRHAVGFIDGPEQPTQIRLALTQSETEMRVMWTSSIQLNSIVQFGSASHQLTRSSASLSHRYDAADMCEAPANVTSSLRYRDPGWIHDAVMNELQPGDRCFYRVGSDHHWSKEYSFIMPPRPGDGDPIKFFVFADLSEYKMLADLSSIPAHVKSDPATTLARVQTELEASPPGEYAALCHVGDISYARGFGFVWEQYGAMIEPIATQIPYMVGVGNHEYCYTDGGEHDPSGAKPGGFHVKNASWWAGSHGECGVPFANRFHIPDNGNAVFWYSVEIGSVHHTFISTEHANHPGSKQHGWLQNDLAQINRTKTPWVFVHGHRPLYCSEAFKMDYQSQLVMRKAFESLLMEYRVDAFFAGHYHAYERTCPVFEEQCRTDDQGRAQAPVHIMVGSAGQPRDHTEYWRKKWSMNAQLVYGYTRVSVPNSTHLRVEFVRNNDSKVTDSTWIIPDRTDTAQRSSRRVPRKPAQPNDVLTTALGWLIGAALVMSMVHFFKQRDYDELGAADDVVAMGSRNDSRENLPLIDLVDIGDEDLFLSNDDDHEFV